jgi:Protein kinase domain/PDZ domain
LDGRVGLPANTILGESYRIVRQIGAGGFGITYAAEDINLGITVAIKEYYPEEFGDRNPNMSVRAKSERHKPTFEWGRSSFIQEARTLARFQHASVVRVSRVFEANSTAYMVMDFEQGQSFEAWLKGLGRLPTQEELDRIVGPLLDALETMHAENFLHRDIAPDNIIIRANGTPVLLDFGASRRAVAEKSRTLTGIVKAGYSPQEQYASDSRLQGPWSDLYALGATLYRAVTGTPPEEATIRVADDRMVPAAGVTGGGYRPAFLAGIDACLEVRHTDRPQSVAQLRPILLGHGSQPSAPLPKTRKIDAPRSRRRIWPIIAATVAIVIGGSYGVWEYARRQAYEADLKQRIDEVARQQADAAAAKRKAEEEASARKQAEARRQQEDRVATDPSAPFSEYFRDMTRVPAQAAVPPSASTGSTVPSRQGNGWLGIKMQSLTDDLAEGFGAKNGNGALVAIVTPDSPARNAGLKEGDIVLRFDGKDIRAMPDLMPAIRATAVGKTVDIVVWRDGQMTTLKAIVGRTAEEPTASRRTRRRN